MKLGGSATERRLAIVEEQLAMLLARVERMEARALRPPLGAASAGDQDEDELILDTEKAEYLIGAQLLPRLGAVLIVLAVILLAVLGSSKGGSSSSLPVLGGGFVVCLAFIAIGEWKRNELEGFGQVLTAIGSCGLFLTAASASFAYDLLSADAVSIVFLALAVLHLIYSSWRKSRAFHVMGVLGGLSAAIFPLAHHNFVLADTVYAMTAIAGGYVVAKQKWPAFAIAQWVMGLVALVPLVASDQSWELLIPAFYVASLALTAAYLLSLPPPQGKNWPVLAPLAVFVTGLVGWGMQHAYLGALHVSLLCVATALVGQLLQKGTRARTFLLIGVFLTGSVLIPWCFPWALASILFAALAVVGWIVSRSIGARFGAVFAFLELFMAACAYSCSIQSGLEFALENTILVALAGGIAGLALAAREAKWNGVAVAATGSWILITRWAQVLLGHFRPDAGSPASTLAWIVYAVLLLILGFGLRSATLRFCSLAVMFVTIGKILMVDMSTTGATFRVAMLLVLGLLMLLGGYAYVRGSASKSAHS